MTYQPFADTNRFKINKINKTYIKAYRQGEILTTLSNKTIKKHDRNLIYVICYMIYICYVYIYI